MLLVLSLSDVDLAATSKVMTGRSFAWGRLAGPTLPPLSRRGWRPVPTPSLHFCYPGATGLRFRPGRQPAVEPAAPLSRHNPHDARSSGSGLGAAPRSEFALQRQPCVRQAALEQLPTPMPFTTGSFRACASGFSDSEQWSSPVKPPRSQNYVKPHNARTRVHVAIFRALFTHRDHVMRVAEQAQAGAKKAFMADQAIVLGRQLSRASSFPRRERRVERPDAQERPATPYPRS